MSLRLRVVGGGTLSVMNGRRAVAVVDTQKLEARKL
jgi:hypothetical protein